MSQLAQQLSDQLTALARQNGPAPTVVGVVKEVDTDAGTCVLEVEGDADLPLVRLSAIEGAADTLGLYILPKVGSYGVALRLGEEDAEHVLLHATDISQLVIRGGGHGGVVKVQQLVDRLNALEASLKQLQNLFLAHVHPTPTGPSSRITPPPGLTDPGSTQVADLENPRVQHG